MQHYQATTDSHGNKLSNQHHSEMYQNMFIDLVRLHVFLYIGLLGKWSATDDALKWFLSCVTDGEIEISSCDLGVNCE